MSTQNLGLQLDEYAALLSDVALFPPTYTDARNASLLWYSILTSFNTTLDAYLFFFPLTYMYTLSMHVRNSVKLNLVARG